MSAVNPSLPNLDEALQRVNGSSSERGYAVVVTNEKIEPKKPIYLQLQYVDGTTQNIGITHLVRLEGSDWDEKPFEVLAKSTDQVAQAILERIALFFDAKGRGLYIDEDGTIFDFNGIDVTTREDNTFSIDDTPVTYKGVPLQLSRLKSEGIFKFIRLANGETELVDQVDQRNGKRMLIKTNGELYRA